ncbi:MAG: SDR family NAD(P)-dependent oxidoreductase [Sphingomonadaceae bacterium]
MGRQTGKIVVITGGASGIGLATAKLFASEGAIVIIADLDRAALDAAASIIDGDVDALSCDVSRVSDLQALRAHIERTHGRVDVVFANAGSGRPGPFETTTEEDFDFTVDTNLKGTFFTVQTLLPLMRPGSSIILNTSIQSVKGFPGFTVYAATKAAIRSLARTLTAELGPKGIRTNAVAPGYINTDIRRKVGMSEEMIREDNHRLETEVPLKRLGSPALTAVGEPEEIAKAVLFLASEEADYISGIEIAVDGGTSQI